jgi:hypothetical protein
VGFLVDRVSLGQVFSEYFDFPCQFSYYQILHAHLSSGAGTIGQIVADVPRGLSLTPPQEIKKKVVITWVGKWKESPCGFKEISNMAIWVLIIRWKYNSVAY